jgi:tetratricopeptide (TPR) repeat protein
MGPLEKNHPLVDEGMEAFERGEYDQALEKFEAADKALPGNAAIAFNRGATLHKLGRNEDALQAFNQALTLDKGELAEKIHYNEGNVLAALDKKKEAIAEYRRALRLDPKDQLARHNLEVLLRDLPPKQDSSSPDGGTPVGVKADGGRPDAGPDGGHADGGMDAGTDGGSGDAGRGDGGNDGGSDGGAGDGGRGDGGDGQGDGGRDGGKGDGGQGQGDKQGDAGKQGDGQGDAGNDGGHGDEDGGQGGEEPEEMRDGGGGGMSKADAEKLLDSMKNSEKNLQLWRFQQKSRTRPNGKDW